MPDLWETLLMAVIDPVQGHPHGLGWIIVLAVTVVVVIWAIWVLWQTRPWRH
jgi:hypothetical protein